MNFDATLTIEGDTALILLRGALDAESDGTFLKQVNRVLTHEVREIVLDMSELDRLSAAGIRALAYVRQQMAENVRLVIVSPTDGVRETLVSADFDDSVAIRE